MKQITRSKLPYTRVGKNVSARSRNLTNYRRTSPAERGISAYEALVHAPEEGCVTLATGRRSQTVKDIILNMSE